MYNPLTNNWSELIMVERASRGEGGRFLRRLMGPGERGVSAEFGVQLLQGRHFSRADNESAAPVATVNQAFVRRIFFEERERARPHLGWIFRPILEDVPDCGRGARRQSSRGLR